MSSKELTAALIAGLIASGLFLIIFGLGLGFLFMFLPTLPLLSIGMGKQPRLALAGAAIACGIVTAAAGLPPAILFLVFLGLPAWYIAKESLRYRTAGNGQREWFPVGVILMHLTLAACCSVAVVTLYYYYAGPAGGIATLLAQNIREAFADVKEQYGDVIETLATGWAFLVFSITVWLWGIALYAHAWLVNRALRRQNIAVRPDFSVQPFTIPAWMLSLLAICALASLIGSPSVSFLGKSTMISLMLPYFFLGASLMHAASKNWSSRRFFLFFVYFMVLAQFWPALILSGIGLWHQIKLLSSGGNSSKS